VELPSVVLAEIEANIYNNGTTERAASITCALFDTARHHIHQSLEQTKLEKYKQSSPYKSYLAQQRTVMKQKERPTECVLCSVKNGIHAMHPLYDVDGKDGRQLVLSASGVGFMRKEKRLAWVHTLCAMFICSSERTGSLVYGCDEDGNWETPEEEEEEEEDVVNRKVIDSDDEEDEPLASLEEEQLKFTKCEKVFQPLMKRLQQVNNDDGSNDVNDIIECIDSMMESVDLLTPSFVREYQIGQLVKRVKKSFEVTHPEVKSHCKRLSAEMKRVYNEKERKVPDGFEPIKNMKEGKVIDNNKVPNDNNGENYNGDDNNNNASQANTDDGIEQKYKIGTAVSKEFLTGTHAGNITDYDSVTKLYQIIYEDGDSEDLNETEVSQLLLSYTAWFCMAAPVNGKEIHASQCIKSMREFICVICKKKDNASNKCLRIPVQCSTSSNNTTKHSINK